MKVIGQETDRLIARPEFRDAVRLLLDASNRGDCPMPRVLIDGRELRLVESIA